MFFGTIVKPGKPVPVVPHAEGFALHLSQVALPADVPEKTRVSLLVRVGGDEPVLLCTLTAGVQDTVLLDQFLTEYAELSVSGAGTVHITGYYSPNFGSPDDDEDDEDEEDYGVAAGGHPLDHVFGVHPHDLMDEDEDEDEDDEGEAETETGEEELDDFMASRPAARRKEPSVIIEDITDQQAVKPGLKALPPTDSKGAEKKRKAADADGIAAKKQAVQPAKGEQKQKKQEQQQQQEKQQQQQQQKEQQQLRAGKQASTDAKQQKQQQKQQKQQKQQPEAGTPEGGAPSPAAQVTSSKKGVKRFENGFEVHNSKMGDPHGKLAKAGKTVKVRYTGRLKSNGKVFDKTTKKPFAFRLGVGEVIKGWDAGVEGMRVGDVRKLVIPPVMGYGSSRTGPIPPNSTLEFDVELVDVK